MPAVLTPQAPRREPKQIVRIVNGQKVIMMLVRMRCEACGDDHRLVVESDLPLGRLPEITRENFRCKCKSRIPKITKMDKSLMSINAVPFRLLKGLPMFAGAKWST